MNITAVPFYPNNYPSQHFAAVYSQEVEKVIQEVKAFVFSIRYVTEVRNFQKNIAKQKKGHRDQGLLIKEFLGNPHHQLSYQATYLQDRVQLLGRSEIGKAWNIFYDAVKKQSPLTINQEFNELKALFPVQEELKEFGDTDLSVCSHPTTPNGITPENFRIMQDTYKKYTSHLRYDVSHTPNLDEETLRTQVERDIRYRMSRDAGRDLADRILAKLDKDEILTIVPGNRFVFYWRETPPHKYIIQYSLTPDKVPQILPNGEIRFIEAFPFTSLGHEEAHFSNVLHKEVEHDPDPELYPHYTDSEEERTITGFCNCSHHAPLLSCENALRLSFGHFPRDSHSGYPACATQQEQMDVEMRIGAEAEFLDRIRKNEIASPDLDHAMRRLTQGQHGLKPGIIDKVIKTASENKTLQHRVLKRLSCSSKEDDSSDPKKSKPSSSSSSSSSSRVPPHFGPPTTGSSSSSRSSSHPATSFMISGYR
ncbi:MAG TPA: hypothetical protein VLE89_06675 [Chlamydiales bacterium]|nr:hypothetical protein [Chlamydiales bacterium]